MRCYAGAQGAGRKAWDQGPVHRAARRLQRQVEAGRADQRHRRVKQRPAGAADQADGVSRPRGPLLGVPSMRPTATRCQLRSKSRAAPRGTGRLRDEEGNLASGLGPGTGTGACLRRGFSAIRRGRGHLHPAGCRPRYTVGVYPRAAHPQGSCGSTQVPDYKSDAADVVPRRSPPCFYIYLRNIPLQIPSTW